MSKYNLTELLSEVKGGRIGTLNISAMDLERKMEELEDEGIKVSTFDSDNFGKTYIEYHVHPENKYDPDESFSIYDYKFGEDPTDIDNVDKEYPFSIGGMSAALNSAKALLGAGQVSYSIDEGEAVDLAIEASQEKAGIEVDESFKSLAKKLDKQKGIDKDEAAKIAGSIAAKKAAGAGKGPTAKQKKRMKEAREYAPMDRDVANRIEGFLNIPMKKKFLDAWEDLFYDLVDDEPFYVDDVIAHLANEMSKSIYGNQMAGDRLAGIGVIDDFEQEEFTDIGESSDEYVDEIGEGAMQPGEADLEAGVKGNMDAYTEGKGVDFIRALKVDGNGTSMEIESYLRSLKKAGDEFDSVDDYVEDFKNYVADKALQEHFGRFMKDYQ